MEAIILAGGFGNRLKSVVADLPKPMAPIGNKPFLQILLESLVKKKFDRVILSLHFMADVIQSYFGNCFLGMEITYVIEKSPLGTGGAIRKSLLECREEKVFIFNGDTYLDINVNELIKKWHVSSQPILVGRFVDDVSRYGALEILNGMVENFSEKNKRGNGFINAGCYLVPKNILNDFAINFPFSFEEDFLKKNIKEKTFLFYESKGYFIDIGIPKDYALAQNYLT
jgi:D-glycero-alpha-D-manno-heptose 1-phosphate guanylyltransferase